MAEKQELRTSPGPKVTNANDQLPLRKGSVPSPEFQRGAELARNICQSCHLFPEPDLLDKATWENAALPFMAKWLGISKINLDLRPGRKYVEEAGIFPASPIIPMQDWEAMCKYYLESAPASALPQVSRPRIQMGLTGFEVITPDYRFKVPLTTMVKIDSARKQFYLGDAGSKTLNVLDPQGNMRFSTPLDSPPVGLTLGADGIRVTLIGSVIPSDEPEGKIVGLRRTGPGLEKTVEFASKLPRPADAAFGDLNDDRMEDFVVCGFGNLVGRFSWFENLGDHQYREHVLLPRPGAVKAYLYDFNRDGRPDIIVMMAQAREGIYIFYNRGKGQFSEPAPVVEYHPAFGSSYFELVDFNRDGFIDILATNGDNGEYASCLRNYHGIRLYLNDGKNQFHEAYFFPLNGAYRAVAADFDHDGDLDIAAISYFPDYDRCPEESFVYLENKGQFRFEAYSFPQCRAGRWLTMDVNDLDGDGYQDIVMGSFIRGPNKVPAAFSEEWEATGPSFLILKNRYGRKK